MPFKGAIIKGLQAKLEPRTRSVQRGLPLRQARTPYSEKVVPTKPVNYQGIRAPGGKKLGGRDGKPRVIRTQLTPRSLLAEVC